jgi:hypothetical protein
MVKVGKVKFIGRSPVVNARVAEIVPSSRTCLMRYVVSGSMPATMKLVLSPGTMDCVAVRSQDSEEPIWANWTYIEVPGEGGALYRATKGLDMGLITALLPVTRDVAVYVAVADSPVGESKLSLTVTRIS